MRAIAWSRSEREKYWGPFTWSPEQSSSGWGFTIKSVGEEDGDSGQSYLRIGLGKRSFLMRTPRWLIAPVKERHYMTSLSEEDLKRYVDRTGRDWYWNVYPREYGFMFHEDSLHTNFGVQNLSWGGPDGSKSKVFFYPWKQFRQIRHDWFDENGDFKIAVPSLKDWDYYNEVKDVVPVKKFAFKDHDGQIIIATLRLEERESALGVGWWKWLSFFFKNRVYRSFDISFSDEVGTEKGSWKGGMIGTSINSDDREELHEAAFKRFCEEQGKSTRRGHAQMTYLHPV